MNTYLVLYRKSSCDPTLGWICRAESKQEASEQFPFPVNSTRIITIINLTEANDIDIPAALEAADNGEYGSEEWRIEVRSSKSGNEITFFAFTGSEMEAMEEAEKRLKNVYTALECDVEILVLNAITCECIYQGSFDICPSYNDIQARIACWEDSQRNV